MRLFALAPSSPTPLRTDDLRWDPRRYAILQEEQQCQVHHCFASLVLAWSSYRLLPDGWGWGWVDGERPVLSVPSLPHSSRRHVSPSFFSLQRSMQEG